MRKNVSSTIIALFIFSLALFSQTDPGTTNLKHQWTFDDGTTADLIGSATGTLMGAANVSNKALSTVNGGYLSFTGSEIGVNTFSAISTELWFTSSAGMNTENTMISYFGDSDVSGWMGNNYIFTSPVNGGNTRVAISTGNTTNDPWTNEDGINTNSIDDGLLHHFVTMVDATSITLYIDGEFISSTALTGTNSLADVSTATAYLCKGGYSGDATWKGLIHKYSIYDKALTADEVLFLFQQGAESSNSINVSVSSLSFDEIYPTSSFTVTGNNLVSDITLATPSGITVEPTTINADAINAMVNVTWDGVTEVNGNITLTSDDVIIYLPVKANSNASCFTPLYEGIPNLIPDPYMNTITDSWGNVSVVSGSEVYCGSHSVRITGSESCWPNGGSVGTNSITWLPNTTYRFHAKVKTMDGSFIMGVQNANVNGGSGDYNITVPYTNGDWADFDATFTTGASPTSGVAFFNNCGSSTGLVAYIDNWELYALPGISTSVNSIILDEFSNTASFTVTGVNLAESITLSASEGLSLDITTLDANAVNATVNVTSSITGTTTGSITLTSGSVSKTIEVNIFSNEECFTPLYPGSENLITDPYLSDISNFDGWGSIAINQDPDFVYCGATSGVITERGSLGKDLTGTMKPNTTYQVKAKVFRKNPGNITYTLSLDSLTYPTEFALITEAMDSACAIYNYYFPIDVNIYVYYDQGIPTAQASYYGSIGFGPSRNYMWVGTAMHEIDHYLGSGTAWEWKNLAVGGKWTGEAGNAVCQEISGSDISSDGTHFWPHGINYRSEIENLGGISKQLEGLHANARVAKAMIVDDAGLGTNKEPLGIGIVGWNADSADIYHEITVTESWQEVNFTFTTGETLGATQSISFNTGPGYIDNWEMYELPVDTSSSISNLFYPEPKVYFQNSNLIVETESSKASELNVWVYDVQGRLLITEKGRVESGYTKSTINTNLSTGIYFVKVVQGDVSFSKKILAW